MLNLIKGGGWIVILVLACAGWVSREISLAGDRREAEILADTAQATFLRLVDSLETWKARKAASDSARMAISAELDSVKTEMRAGDERDAQAILAARTRLTVLEDSIVTLTAEDLAAISAGMDALDEQVRLCNSALGSCEQLVQAADARIWELEAQQEQVLAVSRQQNVTIEQLRNLGEPRTGWWAYAGWGVAALMTALAIVP